MGRPSTYCPEMALEICERMSEGKSLREICQADDMPARKTVLRWVEAHKEFRDQYSRARDAQYDWIAEEAIRIADDSSKDFFIEDRNGHAVVVPDHARVQRARLQVDTRKWILSKLAPRKYGDKVELLTASESGEGSNQKTVQYSWSPSVHLVVYPILDDAGNMLRPGSPEHDAALELAVKQAKAQGRDGDLKVEAETIEGITGTKTYINAEIGIQLDQERLAPAPKQIAYQPEPLPADLTPEDWSLLTEVLSLIRRTIPTGDNSPPETILRVIREALLLHFREVEIEEKARYSVPSST